MRARLLAAACLLPAAACTDVGLYSPTVDPNLADKLSISANLCTEDPGQRAFPIRVILAVGVSGGMQAADPGGRRADAVQQVMSRFSSLDNYEFAVVRYGQGARDLTGCFTRDSTTLAEAAAGLRSSDPGQVRDVAAALQASENCIDEHIFSHSVGEISRTSYIVVLVAAGSPFPLGNEAGAALSGRVRRMRDEALELGAAGFRMHTVLIKPEDPLLANRAEGIYKDMSLAGGGAFIEFLSALELTLMTIDLSTSQTRFAKKQIVVTNANGITTPELVVRDSDGDGISDADESDLGTNALDPDSDGDCVGDKVEMLHKAGGQDPIVPDMPGTCEAMDEPCADRDNDGLTNCEEAVLGTDMTVFDSDADGLPDRVELQCDTNPMHNDTFEDYDFDGVTNGEECRFHTDSRGDDGEARWNLAYRYRENEEGVRIVPFSNQPQNITGLTIIAVSPASTAGVGTLIWYPGEPGDAGDRGTLSWQDAGDAQPGERTEVPEIAETEFGLESFSHSRWLSLRAVPPLLPVIQARDPIVVGSSERNCFSFKVKNITLVETQDLHDGRGPGWNDIYVYFGQVPEENPDSPGLYRVALVRARYLKPRRLVPTSPTVQLEDVDFQLFGD